MADAEQDIRDIIIIRRHASTEAEQVKGGVWKIAFADFMTAMMCFFLVMWLINAANEDTRQAVASYFNPMRLAELNRKGVADPHVTGINTPQRGDPAEEAGEVGGSSGGDAAADLTRDALFRDPYGVLSDIAAEAEEKAAEAQEAPPLPPPPALTENLRDLFDPVAEGTGSSAIAAPGGADRTELETALAHGQAVEVRPGPTPPGRERPAEAQRGSSPAGEEISRPEEAAEAAPSADPLPMSSPPGAAPPADVAIANTPPQLPETSPVPERLPEIERQIAEATEGEGGRSPGVTVERTGGGVLISLTDEAQFGMFAIGSAEPQPQMIRIMERIAEVLRTRPGGVTIRGHTDGRPFRSETYDNWRLSTDRAQMAYYMLVRGGLDERRVAAIEGYADRKLKAPEDPEAAENRRIEIFLREDTP